MRRIGSKLLRSRTAIAIILCAGLAVQAQQARDRAPSPATRSPSVAETADAASAPGPEVFRDLATRDKARALAERDPIGFFEQALARYQARVSDYTCVFTKQERLNGKLSEKETMKAWFRESPYSVRLDFLENGDECKKVLYVRDRWVDKGRQMAVVEPAGLPRLFVSHVMRDINGDDAQESSRRRLTEFGLGNALRLTLKYCRLARTEDALSFSYTGEGQFDGRPTFVFERRLPYTREGTKWPDRVLVIHVDQEYLLPTKCECYADDAKRVLLGRYTYTDIQLNPGLKDAPFTKKAMGL